MSESLLFLLIVCLVSPGIQIVYMIVYLAIFSRARQVYAGDSSTPVSVIVCAHDEEDNLKALVPVLLGQDHPDFEIIIVDDRSNDGTHEYLLEASKRYSRLRVVQVSQTPSHISGKKYALTLGIKAAKNEWVVLTDADCRPDSRSWLRAISQLFSSDKQIAIGYSPYNIEPGLLNSFIRFETVLTMVQYIGMALAGRPYMGVGRNLAYRKSLFLENKGFNNHLKVTGGDDDLFVNSHASSTNVAVAIGPETLVHSAPKKTWKEMFNQKVRHLSVGRRYRPGDKLLLGLFSLTWIFSWFSLVAMPWLGWLALILGGVFLVRWMLLIWLMSTACRKVGEPVGLWKVPFLDLIYTFYYLVAGPVALVSKKVKWKS
jgi:glycosyltransferase involved in cell wall biosynthesis